MRFHNRFWACNLSLDKYVHDLVKNVKAYMDDNLDGKYKFPKLPEKHFSMSYTSEINVTPILEPLLALYYLSLIGIIGWVVELGRVDIAVEVPLLASHMSLTREGHIESALHIFAYLGQKYNSHIAFNLTYPDIDESSFKDCDWRGFYDDMKEAIPPNSPTARDKEVD